MAKDLLLKHVCPHYVVREWLQIESDRRTLNTVRLPSSQAIRLEVNGIEVPKAGLAAPVSVAGTLRQPFEIVRNVNDVLRLTVDDESLQIIYLPVGTQVSAKVVVEAINEQAVGFEATTNFGRIRLTTESVGSESTLYLQGGNGHETLGLAATRFYRGRDIIPGWDLVRTPNTVDQRERQVKFRSQLKSSDDILEVSYFTRQQECRRCSGLGIENDIRFDDRGDPIFVTGIDLLAQEIEKISFTIRGTNIFYDWYGTSITALIGSKIVRGGSYLETQLVNEIGNTLERFRSVKNQQARLQPVTDQEFFQRVKTLSVVQDPQDPTVFRIRIEIQNAANEVAELTQNLIVTGSGPQGSRLVG